MTPDLGLYCLHMPTRTEKLGNKTELNKLSIENCLIPCTTQAHTAEPFIFESDLFSQFPLGNVFFAKTKHRDRYMYTQSQ